ncbi:restriction endonuclease subunit S [Pseudoalteromonas aurantia]|uniref:Restriction endonuclease subunit S n=1 Tax=Pseudoalteromonas aurantia TaxID=43654 RepID=A0ABY2W201_9GAMM|nr:restriction endonuclease subunit S [Pseudoalteromonas aurantia]TMO78237.1 restriction endonuclease subunit S [Pseudoalteromonas aurantia]
MASNWKKVGLNDLGEVARGKSKHRPRYAEHLYGGKYPFIQTGDIKASGGLVSTHSQTYSEAGLAQSRLWPTNTMCITIAANIAETGILTYPACFPDSVIGFIADESLCDVRFIEYRFRYLKAQLQREAIGSVQDNINLATFERLKFSIPELEEQKRIADVLYSLDNKIQLNRQTNQTLEKMAQALFKSWFVDFDPVFDNALASGMAVNDFPEALQKKALSRQQQRQQVQQKIANGESSAGKELDDKPLPADILNLFPSDFEQTDEPSIGINSWIPKGWNIEAISKAIQVNPKTSLPKQTVAKFADMKAIPTSGYMVDEIIEKEYKGGAKFIEKDILFARITPCLQNGKTALVDFLSDGEVGFGSTEFIVLRQKDKVSYPFVACLAREDGFRAHCMQSMVGSSGRQRVQNACFDDYYLALPDKQELLEQFTEMTSANFSKMIANKLESQSLTKLRDTLLPKLISGELTLPADNSKCTAATEAYPS